MYSVATSLVKSLEFNPIGCATTLCQFGRTLKGYVVIHFILLSSTAKSSATSGQVVVPGFGTLGPENRLNELKNGLGKCLVLFPVVFLIDSISKHM